MYLLPYLSNSLPTDHPASYPALYSLISATNSFRTCQVLSVLCSYCPKGSFLHQNKSWIRVSAMINTTLRSLDQKYSNHTFPTNVFPALPPSATLSSAFVWTVGTDPVSGSLYWLFPLCYLPHSHTHTRHFLLCFKLLLRPSLTPISVATFHSLCPHCLLSLLYFSIILTSLPYTMSYCIAILYTCIYNRFRYIYCVSLSQMKADKGTQ